MKRSAITLAALGALLVLPAARAVAAPVTAHHGSVVSTVIPPEYCLGVLGSDWERIFCSDGPNPGL